MFPYSSIWLACDRSAILFIHKTNYMKTLFEGLLDDDIFNDIDKAIATEWLKANVKSQYKVMQLKTGELKIWGKLVIKNVDEIGWLNISLLDGDLYIENCRITDLSKIFSDYAKVTGNVSIVGCKNLSDITGLPRFVDGDVTITNCPALKSLEGVSCLAGEVSIMRCGKRFSQSAVKSAFPAAIKIFCSEEDIVANLNEAVINESFQDPILIRLYDQIRNLKKKFNLNVMFGEYSRLDQLSPSDRETFRMDSDKNEKAMLKAARKICANTNRLYGFIATEDWDGNFVIFINNTQNMYWLKDGGFPGDYRSNDVHNVGNVTTLMDVLKRTSRYMNDVKYVHIWFPEGDRYKIRHDRMDLKDGIIDPRDPDQMYRFRREQLDRYTKAAKAIRAARNTDKYKATVEKVDKIMERFNKFMNKVIMDQKWASVNQWRLSGVFDSIRKGYERGASYQKYGVIYAFQNWSTSVVRTLSGESSYGQIDDKPLLDAIAWADKELNAVGM